MLPTTTLISKETNLHIGCIINTNTSTAGISMLFFQYVDIIQHPINNMRAFSMHGYMKTLICAELITSVYRLYLSHLKWGLAFTLSSQKNSQCLS